jgi:CubicO group peptidase (beta-lactamase class C family)
MTARMAYVRRLAGIAALLVVVAAVTPASAQWEFNTAGNTEGWGNQHSITGLAASGGSLNGTISGSDPYVLSGMNLGIDISAKDHVVIRMKNSTSTTSAQVYFVTNSDLTWSESKHKNFVITANDPDFTEYVIDMSTLPTWTGTLYALRVDPSATAMSGSFQIDFVRVTQIFCTTNIVFPGTTWTTKTPGELGLDETKLNQFASNLGGVGCIIRQGYMVKSWGADDKGDWASAAKPVLSTMLFFAIEEGRLSGVHNLIRDWGWSLIAKDQPMEFFHLANMTSGYARGEIPGAAWAYNDYAIQLYAKTLFDRVYGTSADAAARDANRLGFLQFQDGTIFGSRGGYGVEASPRDFARIGWLWCNKGYWNGTQLLPQHYFDDYMKPQVSSILPRTSSGGSDYLGVGTIGGGSDQTGYGPGIYGFNWWFNPSSYTWPDAPDDIFQANGHWGEEVVTVIPSLSLVVACRGSWGSFEPGNASSGMNQNLKLLTEACPAPKCIPANSIVVDSEHPAWFKYQNGDPFFMCGPGDPEGFLYRGTRNSDGTRTGDQMTLINKLIGTGANCIYLMTIRSHGGDGDSTQNPWVDSNINNALDEDILNQWETWFTEMDNNGITVYFIFYDDSSAPFGRDVGSSLDSREANLIDTVVSRFKHHQHLIWCVAEEYAEALSTAHISKIAERIKLMDDRQHPVAVHQNNGTSFDFNGNANVNQFAVQYNTDSASALHAAAVAAWNNVGGLKNINLAEFDPLSTGSVLRQKVWAIAMGGAYSMILGMDIASTSVSDLEICGRLVQFMEATRFNETVPYDSLARGNTDYVLASPGNVYIAYGDSGGSLGVNVQAGTYSVRWYDPADGEWVHLGILTLPAGDQTFTKPGVIAGEAALYLSETDVPPLIAEVTPDPETVKPGTAYVKQLTLLQGNPLPGWSIEQAPPGTQVSSSGLVTGWTPAHSDIGSVFTFSIKATNSAGSDSESWQLSVQFSADFDGDGDVDQEDFGVFQSCICGSTEGYSAGCAPADLDGDGDVDLNDWTLFNSCVSGPGLPPRC